MKCAMEDQWQAGRIQEALFIWLKQREGKIITSRNTGNLKTRQWDPILGKLAVNIATNKQNKKRQSDQWLVILQTIDIC